MTAAHVRFVGGPAGDEVTVRLARSGEAASLTPGSAFEATLRPSSPFVYKDSFVYVLRFRSRRPATALDPAGRATSAFVSIRLETAKRSR